MKGRRQRCVTFAFFSKIKSCHIFLYLEKATLFSRSKRKNVVIYRFLLDLKKRSDAYSSPKMWNRPSQAKK